MTRRLLVTNPLGDPAVRQTWSSAPSRVIEALRTRRVDVIPMSTAISGRPAKIGYALHHLLTCGSLTEPGRGTLANQMRTKIIARTAGAEAIDRVLLTSSLDFPYGASHLRRYLYLDFTFDLLCDEPRWAVRYSGSMRRQITAMERRAFAQADHVFTFGRFVRDAIIDRCGVSTGKVTAVGAGSGDIAPVCGSKDYATGHLLFVAKQLFVEKGGLLTLEAFRGVRQARPETRLVIVGNDEAARYAGRMPGVTVHGFLPSAELQALYDGAALLVQPMLNDPWGQVFTEALKTRTPVIGLRRNALPEILDGGRFGFLLEREDSDALARLILEALAQPELLRAMGEAGQAHALQHYTWECVAETMANIIFSETARTAA